MKACIYGAGAIGGLLGARLCQAGWDVSLIARGPQLEAIRRAGLRLRTRDEEFTVNPRATDRPQTLGAQDMVLVTTKTTALVEIAPNLASLIGPGTAVTFVTNGLPWWYLAQIEPTPSAWSAPVREITEALSRVVPLAQCIGGVAYAASHVGEPGLVINSNSATSRFVFGAVEDDMVPACERLATALTAAGLPSTQERPLAPLIWSKLLQNVISGPLGALTGMTSRSVVTDPVLIDTVKVLSAEAETLASACGMSDVAPDLAKFAARVADHKSSMLQDYELGRRPEIDTLLGALCDLGRIKGIETPSLDLIYALTRAKAVALGIYR